MLYFLTNKLTKKPEKFAKKKSSAGKSFVGYLMVIVIYGGGCYFNFVIAASLN
ncbi:MAG: hypothetical protein GY861_28125 [bacterium]|nr:hypothetical protein [bacterium]